MYVASKDLARQALRLIDISPDSAEEREERKRAVVHAANTETIYAPLVQKWCEDKKQNWKRV